MKTRQRGRGGDSGEEGERERKNERENKRKFNEIKGANGQGKDLNDVSQWKHIVNHVTPYLYTNNYFVNHTFYFEFQVKGNQVQPIRTMRGDVATRWAIVNISTTNRCMSPPLSRGNSLPRGWHPMQKSTLMLDGGCQAPFPWPYCKFFLFVRWIVRISPKNAKGMSFEDWKCNTDPPFDASMKCYFWNLSHM